MNDIVVVVLSSAVIAAIVSSLIGPYVNRAQERRRSKAEVLQALMSVEVLRWASHKHPYEKYLEAVQKLRAAALIARTHRELLELYVQASALARSGSDDDFETQGDSEFGGSIDSDVANFVSAAAEALTFSLWRPYSSRLGVKKTLEDLRSRRVRLKRKYTAKKARFDRIYDWDRVI